MVVPSIASRYPTDRGLVQNLGLALLFVVLEEEASDDLFMLSELPWLKAMRDAYNMIPVDNKP